ncbi:helix-turn-helix domain-containing protein [Flindersiella endophytica]
MAAASTWPARFAVLDDILGRHADHRSTPDGCAGYVWRRILETNGTARIGDLAEETGYGRRQLGVRFTREFGLTPKQAARVVRFEHSRELVRRVGRTGSSAALSPRPSLADIAARCGYYDQAHLAREWTALAGCAPSVWMASEQLSFVQDTAADAPAGS